MLEQTQHVGQQRSTVQTPLAEAISLPLEGGDAEPWYGEYPWKMEFRIPLPRVSVLI